MLSRTREAPEGSGAVTKVKGSSDPTVPSRGGTESPPQSLHHLAPGEGVANEGVAQGGNRHKATQLTPAQLTFPTVPACTARTNNPKVRLAPTRLLSKMPSCQRLTQTGQSARNCTVGNESAEQEV